MPRKDHAEHARVTAICVNLALDSVEQDLRDEISKTQGETALALRRLLERIRTRRINSDELQAVGSC